MLMPDVTAILYDPEVGGGQAFQVLRTTAVRSRGGYTRSTQTLDAIGNIQPQEMSNQASTTEDLLNESIVVYSTFFFQTGSNSGGSIVEADIILYDNIHWRVTRVEDWAKWGYSRAYATRVKEYVPPTPQATETGEQTVTEG